jgi:hypothetical protein
VVVTIPNDALFEPESAVIPGAAAAKNSKQEKARNEALEKLKEQFKGVLEHVALNPGDRLRIESHTDNTPLPKPKGKKAKGFKDNLALTKARAAAVSSLLRQFGVTGKNRVIAVGMADKLPKAPNTTPEGRERNNRIEIVLYPSDVKITTSAKLPLLKDRERVMVSMSYTNGPAIRSSRWWTTFPGTPSTSGDRFLPGAAAEGQRRSGLGTGRSGRLYRCPFLCHQESEKAEPVNGRLPSDTRRSPIIRLRVFDPKYRPERAIP